MTGIELFYEEANKRNLTIGAADASAGETNGNFPISNHQGRSTVQNMKRIAEIYGTLTFFHFGPEEAMGEIFNMIEMNLA